MNFHEGHGSNILLSIPSLWPTAQTSVRKQYKMKYDAPLLSQVLKSHEAATRQCMLLSLHKPNIGSHKVICSPKLCIHNITSEFNGETISSNGLIWLHACDMQSHIRDTQGDENRTRNVQLRLQV